VGASVQLYGIPTANNAIAADTDTNADYDVRPHPARSLPALPLISLSQFSTVASNLSL
jgi:hypothetical protein